MAHLTTESETIAMVCALHNPEAVKEAMMYEIWEDGEITLTKAGCLYGLRALHLISYGNEGLALPPDSLPIKNAKHSRIWAADRETATKARNLIFGR